MSTPHRPDETSGGITADGIQSRVDHWYHHVSRRSPNGVAPQAGGADERGRRGPSESRAQADPGPQAGGPVHVSDLFARPADTAPSARAGARSGPSVSTPEPYRAVPSGWRSRLRPSEVALWVLTGASVIALSVLVSRGIP